jgi:hypothetical protein
MFLELTCTKNYEKTSLPPAEFSPDNNDQWAFYDMEWSSMGVPH